MPPLTPERRAELIAATKEAAVAFLEDLEHLREVVTHGDPSRADIRRLSGILRRLLCERDIAEIASPRLGRVILHAPDNNPYYHSERQRPFLFFASCRARFLEGNIGALFAYDVKHHPLFGPTKLEIPKHDPDATIELPVDNFLSQRVLCYRGEWVSRKAVIKYVANAASGVHSLRHPDQLDRDDRVLAQIRSSSSFSKTETGIHLELFAHGIDVDKTDFRHAPDSLDPVMVELLATATFFVESPFVAELENFIRAELAADSDPHS